MSYRKPKTSFFKIFFLSSAVLGLVALVYIVPYKTHILPKADYPITSPIIQTDYFLDRVSGDPLMTTNTDYELHALLRRRNGSVVINQSAYEYHWSNDYPRDFNLIMTPNAICTNKIKPPCPNDHLTIRSGYLGSKSATNVRAIVTEKSSGLIIASTLFGLNILSPDMHGTIATLSPDGGENFKTGQKVTISWSAPTKPVEDYYSIDYIYYKNGEFKGGYVGSPSKDALSYNWVIPKELKGQSVKLRIEARSNSYIIAQRYSADYFTVR